MTLLKQKKSQLVFALIEFIGTPTLEHQLVHQH